MVKVSQESEDIARDITDLFDEFKIPLEEWELHGIPLISAYFRSLEDLAHFPPKPDGTLREDEGYVLHPKNIASLFLVVNEQFSMDQNGKVFYAPLFEKVYYHALDHRKKYLVNLDESLRGEVHLALAYLRNERKYGRFEMNDPPSLPFSK